MDWDIGHSPGHVEGILETLGRIAEQYDCGSPEQVALETAAKAILFSYHESVVKAFEQFLKECGEDATEAAQEHLRLLRQLLPEK
jgi:hypothetical protein